MIDFEALWKALQFGSGYPLFFNSVLFLIVFSAFYFIYALNAQIRSLRIFWIVAANLGMYFKLTGAYSIPFENHPFNFTEVYLPVFIFPAWIAFTDWIAGQKIISSKSESAKRWWLYWSLISSLCILFVFNYLNFFQSSFYQIGGWGNVLDPILKVTAPIGLSYYTFKSISYILDIYNETLEEAETNYFAYFAYLLFFGNVVLGPITRARDFLPQLKEKLHLDQEVIGKAFYLFVKGLFKKLIIADFLYTNYINVILGSPDSHTGLQVLSAICFYGLALYNDFSGYSDMACGIGLLMGFDLGINFNQPFKATNVSDFWRRWHISLSSWFNEYVHEPLSFGWRKWGKWGICSSILITFLLSGFWHGASSLYLIWGFLHGAAISYEFWATNFRKKLAKRFPVWLYRSLSQLLTHFFLVITFFFFRANDFDKLGLFLHQIFFNFQIELFSEWLTIYQPTLLVAGLGYFLIIIPSSWKEQISIRFNKLHWSLQMISLYIGILLIFQIQQGSSQPPVYLQF